MEHSQGREFSIQDTTYILHTLQGKVSKLEAEGQERTIWVSANGNELSFQIPWHTDVDTEHEVRVVYSTPKDQPQERIPYYIYDQTTHNIELNNTHPKPNKSLAYALVDFILVVLLGMFLAKPVLSLTPDNPVWGLGALLGLMIGLFVLVNRVTYALQYGRNLSQVQRLNTAIKEAAGED